MWEFPPSNAEVEKEAEVFQYLSEFIEEKKGGGGGGLFVHDYYIIMNE